VDGDGGDAERDQYEVGQLEHRGKELGHNAVADRDRCDPVVPQVVDHAAVRGRDLGPVPGAQARARLASRVVPDPRKQRATRRAEAGGGVWAASRATSYTRLASRPSSPETAPSSPAPPPRERPAPVLESRLTGGRSE